MPDNQSFKSLYKQIDITARTRFNASQRLRRHAKYSTYTVAVLSLVLILVSLMQAYNLGVNIGSPMVGLIQIFSSIAVLVYSLLKDQNDYSNISEKMYSCGSKLICLKNRLSPHVSDDYDGDIYNKFQQEYFQILEHYVAHSQHDFPGDFLKAKASAIAGNPNSKQKHRWLGVKANFAIAKNFASYVLVLGSIFYMLIWLW